MMGCIPVIDAALVTDYEQTFRGVLYTNIPLKEIAVYVDQTTFYSGETLVQLLANISMAEVERRRANLKELAPLMQVMA